MTDSLEIPPRRTLAEAAGGLAARVGEVRARQAGVALATGAAMAATALSAWLVSETAVDFLSNLPWLARLAFFLAGTGGAGAALWFFGVRIWREKIADEAVALMVERALPEFRSRFIAAVQLAKAEDGTASPALVRALVAETTALATQLKFDAVVKTASLKKWLRTASAALALTAALAVFAGPKTRPLVLRACLFNNPVPRKTLIAEVTGNRVIALGDDLKIEALASGVIPAKGRLRVTTEHGARLEFELAADAARAAHFARVLLSVQEPFDYTVALGDAESARFHVRVKPRPAVAAVECQQVWPAYTQRPAQRRALGDLKVLAGSRLALKVRTGTPVRAGEIRLLGGDREQPVQTAPLAVFTPDKTQLAGEVAIPAEGVSGLTLRLVDDDGVESRGAAIYHIDVLSDTPPTIKITQPARREILLTREATALLGFEARDDFGVARVRLHFAVDWVEGAPDKTLDLDLGGALPLNVARRFDWRIGAIVPHVEEGSVIDFWFEALDANDVTGPGLGTVEHYQARIVSDAEKRADLANQLSDTMEGLNGVRQGQEEVNQKLGEIIFEKPAEPRL